MKNLKKVVAATVAVSVIASAGIVFASEYKRPVEIASEVTGDSTEDLRNIRVEEERTYGNIAEDYGKLDEFRTIMLEQKKALLDEKVESGDITQDQADEIHESFCSDVGQMNFGKDFSLGFGKGLHKNEAGEGKRNNMNMNFDGQGKRNNMNQNGEGRGPGRGWERK
ncbi:hypothetical protein RBH29_12120 [Herbivorax sp. ANBcel31]|uniref:hypothetical protein n=1 Tax=Herbivorax sp. ANBcel31 TaxID=3069754 RepID=UPI0027AE0DA4|nr:hypothetical protein [Herbivorax sp. ANBcel31]MDQ2087173.1 hypothetical protein [Herbivorax sp. ANBcel31]